MTIAELIESLQKFPPDAEVESVRHVTEQDGDGEEWSHVERSDIIYVQGNGDGVEIVCWE